MSHTGSYIGTADTIVSTTTPQSLHREAMEQLEKSIEHHRQAALFHEAGDGTQAANHGTIAFDHAAHAVKISGAAMFVQPQVLQAQKRPRTLSWVVRVADVAKKIWPASSSR